MILNRFLPVALFLAALPGCDEGPHAPIPSPGPVRSSLILRRLEEPIPALPGTRFVSTTPGETEQGPILPRFSGERHRQAAYGRNQLGANLTLDLTNLDLFRLFQRAAEISPGQMNASLKGELSIMKRWDDMMAAAKAGRDAVLVEFSTAVALHFADVYSGLGLGLVRLSSRVSATDCAVTYALADPEGANVMLLNVSIGMPHAKAFVSLSYVAHFNGTPPVPFQASPAWGTRKN